MRKGRILVSILIIYLLIGIVFGVSSFIERASYDSLKNRIIDLAFSIIFWPLTFFSRLICHEGNIIKIFKGCSLLPPGFS